MKWQESESKNERAEYLSENPRKLIWVRVMFVSNEKMCEAVFNEMNINVSSLVE